MGIYERDYYRQEGPSLLGSLVEGGLICKWLIAINIVCFLLQLPQLGGAPFTSTFILDVDAVKQGQVWRLLTSAFLHGGIYHIVFNMLALWWFGRRVEDVYGHREFLAFYLVSAVFSSVAYIAAAEMGLQRGQALGASGAISACLVLCALHFPRMIIYVMFVLPLSIWLFVVGFVVYDLFHLLATPNSGIGHGAHLGGALFAYIYHRLGWRILNIWPSLGGLKKRLNQPRLRVYREEEPPRAPVSRQEQAVDEHLEAQMDAILEKISRVGEENLTESERQTLIRASALYKKRRH